MIVRSKISKEEVAQMPKEGFGGRIVVVQADAEVDKAVRFLESQPIVGIDTETKPNFRKGRMNKVSLLQVSTDEICFLFRLNLVGVNESIVRLLENPAVLKVGLSLSDDVRALHRRGDFRQQSFVDLQDYVKDFGIQDNSLQKIYAILFGSKISKTQQLSNWEADVLTDAQKLYAATDAWACYRIYGLLQELQRTGDYVTETLEEA